MVQNNCHVSIKTFDHHDATIKSKYIVEAPNETNVLYFRRTFQNCKNHDFIIFFLRHKKSSKRCIIYFFQRACWVANNYFFLKIIEMSVYFIYQTNTLIYDNKIFFILKKNTYVIHFKMKYCLYFVCRWAYIYILSII